MMKIQEINSREEIELFEQICRDKEQYGDIITEKNRGSMSRTWAEEDIQIAQKEILLLSGSYRNDFWGGPISDLLKKKSQTIKIIVIGGPNLLHPKADNNIIRQLDRERCIQLHLTPVYPRYGIRIVDRNRFFITEIPTDEVNANLDGRRVIYCKKYYPIFEKYIDIWNRYSENSDRFFHDCEVMPEIMEEYLTANNNFFASQIDKEFKNCGFLHKA